jgi:site-specific recombinase XerD
LIEKWIELSPSTIGTVHSTLNGLFSWLYLENEIDANPMLRIERPRRLRPEDVALVTVTRAEVEEMLAATEGWQEFLCLSVLA